MNHLNAAKGFKTDCFTFCDYSFLKNLSYLDLSHNKHLRDLKISKNLIVLNLSNTSSELISNLKILSKSNLEELDLSLNDLNGVNLDFLFLFTKLNLQ